MKKTILFGAGQAGAMAIKLLAAEYIPICFADNSKDKQNQIYYGLSILSLAEALKTEASCVCICALDAVRTEQMESKLHEMGFDGEILYVRALLSFDARVATMRLLAKEINATGIAGDIAELGVYKGEFAAPLNFAFPDRKLHLFDTFSGFPEQDAERDRTMGLSKAQTGDFSETGESLVLDRMPYPEHVVIHKGYFPATFLHCMDTNFAFVSIDADLYSPTAAALPLFWDRLNCGGAIIIHDYNSTQFSGAGLALREFCKGRGLYPVPLSDLHGSAVLIKQQGGL